MTRFAMRLSAPPTVSADEAAESFFWLTDEHSTFTGGLGPSVAALGSVRPLNVDFVRLAVAAFAADRSVPRVRGGSNWNQRTLEIKVPVSKPLVWRSASSELAEVLGFLSGDAWTLSFVQDEPTNDAPQLPESDEAPSRVVLVSGGADSAIGALYSRSLLSDDERHVLVSHFSHTILAPIQRHVAEEVERLLPGPGQEHVAVHLARRATRADGSKWPTEPSSRSRSLLFLALGLAVASIHDVPLWIPENGFASINPPLGSERLGSLSTRTTHPTFLQRLAAALAKIGAHGTIENPFAASTKGEMFQMAARIVGAGAASKLLSATHSCGLTGQRAFGVSSDVPCGVCFGCVLRRASFRASGLSDATNYISPGSNVDLQHWLDENSVEQPIRNLLKRGLLARDLTTLGLPTGYPIRDALDLCQRGLVELGSLYP